MCVAVLHTIARLTIYQAVKDNIDAVDRRILSTVNQLHTMEEALDGWRSNNPTEEQGLELYKKYACIFLWA